MSHLWAELEERLLWRTAFAFGGLSLFFFLFFDAFCFSSEELWKGEGQGEQEKKDMTLCITPYIQFQSNTKN